MSFQYDTLHITHQLTTGIGYPYCLGLGEKIIRGSVYLDGPTIAGDDTVFKTIEGSVMIGPCNNTDSPIPSVCEDWNICGPLKNPYSLAVRAGTHLTRDVKCSTDGAGPGSTTETVSTGAAIFIGDVDIYGELRTKDDVNSKGEVKSNCGEHVLSKKKNFDIPHPTKDGWRLTHTCLEGPEAAVYFRGRVRNSNEIVLPDYWENLVDIDTLTVNLQPIGSHQDIIIKRWDSKKIYLQAKGGMPIDCFYHVYAERKDTEKLIPEYEGTIEDYPGDNSQRSIAGYHYDVKEA